MTPNHTADERDDLLQRLVSELDRTFIAGGHAEGLAAARRMLSGLDNASLRAMALQMRLDEPGEAEPDET